jgi:hypothetical protein
MLSSSWIKQLFEAPLTERISSVFTVGQANLGDVVPWWANVTRLFWVAFVLVLGLVISIRSSIAPKKMNPTIKVLLIWLGAFLVFGGVSIFISPGGDQFHRLLMYAPFFTFPLILLSSKKDGDIFTY